MLSESASNTTDMADPQYDRSVQEISDDRSAMLYHTPTKICSILSPLIGTRNGPMLRPRPRRRPLDSYRRIVSLEGLVPHGHFC